MSEALVRVAVERRDDGESVHHVAGELTRIRDAEIALEVMCGRQLALPTLSRSVPASHVCPACAEAQRRA